jgi:glycosyltransferase involved in cell wall biosynthesis
MNNQSVAILIPCYNEAITIEKVIEDFRKAVPHAFIYVFDNNSTDHSVALAKCAGASVNFVNYQGKGNVIRRMFADVDADVYVLVDGDDTYDATCAPEMIQKLLKDHLDMVVGCRT